MRQSREPNGFKKRKVEKENVKIQCTWMDKVLCILVVILASWLAYVYWPNTDPELPGSKDRNPSVPKPDPKSDEAIEIQIESPAKDSEKPKPEKAPKIKPSKSKDGKNPVKTDENVNPATPTCGPPKMKSDRDTTFTDSRWVKGSKYAPDGSGGVKLWDGSPKMTDSFQYWGQCAVASPLGGIAKRNPTLIEKIVRRSKTKGLFEVDLWRYGKRVTVYVDEYFPREWMSWMRNTHKIKVLWCPIIIKAIAKVLYGSARKANGIMHGADGHYENMTMSLVVGGPVTSISSNITRNELSKLFSLGAIVNVAGHGHTQSLYDFDGEKIHIYDTNRGRNKGRSSRPFRDLRGYKITACFMDSYQKVIIKPGSIPKQGYRIRSDISTKPLEVIVNAYTRKYRGTHIYTSNFRMGYGSYCIHQEHSTSSRRKWDVFPYYDDHNIGGVVVFQRKDSKAKITIS